MSWWSDNETFDEYDPPYCKSCNLLSCENCEYENKACFLYENKRRAMYLDTVQSLCEMYKEK